MIKPSHRLLCLEFLLYAVLTAFALHSTWLTWPDTFIDFSRELYLPWRVSCGDVLYRDLAYYFGPVSVYTNAALFALLGRPSIHALFALNFAFWIATLLALRALLRRIASPLAAVLAVSSFILLFSFNRYTDVGNYNFLAPYSHELPRGLLLALLSLLALDSAFHSSQHPRRLFFLAGFLLALSLFTKPEISISSVFSSFVLFFSRFLTGRGHLVRDGGSRTPLPSVWNFVLGILAALVSVLLPLALALRSFSQALRDGLCKLYLDCFNPARTSLPFFKEVMGSDDIPAHALRLLLGTLLAATPFLLARFTLPRLSSRRLRLVSAIFLALATTAIGWRAWPNLNAALPLAPVLFAAFSLWGRWGSSCTESSSGTRNSNLDKRLPLALAFAAFSFLLSSKILLTAHIWHYGFVLALPAFCCAVLLAFRAPCPPCRTIVAFALLGAFLAGGLASQEAALRNGDIHHPVFDEAYRTAPVKADAFNAALSWIRAPTAPDSTLAVLPEGAVLNVLSGRPNPTPYVSRPATDIPRYDPDDLLAAYSNAPPDTLVLVRKDDQGLFGSDYAQSLMAFLDPLYAPALTLTLTTPSGPVPVVLVATRIPVAP
ncbi:MAG: hypothetical protein J6Y19_06060 [Kiritimatiellae bacterium]|nr:hypothetical protein [Kiritimatiellia bacterium]